MQIPWAIQSPVLLLQVNVSCAELKILSHYEEVQISLSNGKKWPSSCVKAIGFSRVHSHFVCFAILPAEPARQEKKYHLSLEIAVGLRISKLYTCCIPRDKVRKYAFCPHRWLIAGKGGEETDWFVRCGFFTLKNNKQRSFVFLLLSTPPKAQQDIWVGDKKENNQMNYLSHSSLSMRNKLHRF